VVVSCVVVVVGVGVPDVSRERVSLRYVFAGDATCELSSARDSHSGTRPVLMALLLLLLLL
jgi:hypothetical protein